MKYIALLRGINVGGKNPLPMAQLRACFVAAGATAVETYIQSGNVVYEASLAVADTVGTAVSALINREFGYAIPLVTRTAQELSTVIEANPYPAVESTLLHVAFLAHDPGPAAVLDPLRSPGDQFVLRGREIYLYLPNGVARTRLTNAWFDRELSTVSTVRNWRTIQQLCEMSRG